MARKNSGPAWVDRVTLTAEQRAKARASIESQKAKLTDEQSRRLFNLFESLLTVEPFFEKSGMPAHEELNEIRILERQLQKALKTLRGLPEDAESVLGYFYFKENGEDLPGPKKIAYQTAIEKLLNGVTAGIAEREECLPGTGKTKDTRYTNQILRLAQHCSEHLPQFPPTPAGKRFRRIVASYLSFTDYPHSDPNPAKIIRSAFELQEELRKEWVTDD